MSDRKRGVLQNLDLNRMINIGILAALMCIATISNRSFLSPGNLLGVLEQNAAKGVMALGATFVLITGGIDLSMGNGLTMIAVVSSILHVSTGDHAWLLVALCVLIGSVLGSVNGFLITKCRLLPFVATLGMMTIAEGITHWASEGKIMFLSSPAVSYIGRGKVFGVIPFQTVAFLFMSAAAAVILYRTRLGTAAYALGSNEAAAACCGINTARQKFKIYILNGVFIGVAALLTVSRVGQISPNLGGDSMMDAIAAAVIGGTSTMGGRGTIGGTVIGTLIIGVLINALTFMEVPVNAQSAIKGLVILIAIVVDALFTLFHKRKSRKD
ncbi:MAG: ABC transporter permease [Lachnospiraceae bacterium]|jgi:ribose transport system permease protein|nr:ABC transporter permease [Lachnospiraceae bacterium]